MKKIFLLLVVFFVFSGGILFSETAGDPNDDLYIYIELWKSKGYLNNIPALKPYPAQVLKNLLQGVITAGDENDKAIAEYYMNKFCSKYEGNVLFHFEERVSTNDNVHYGLYGFDFIGNGMFSDKASFSGKIGGLIEDREDLGVEDNPISLALPKGMRNSDDFMRDNSLVEGRGRNFLITVGMSSSFAFGTENVYMQAGINRSSFGPFFDDNVILSPMAPQARDISFVWQGNKFTFSTLLMGINATPDDTAGTNGPFTEDFKVNAYPDKYMQIHSIQFFPAKWLELCILESIVYGERFEPGYLIPGSVFYYNSIKSGNQDNILLGGYASAKLPADMGFDLILYTDDANFIDMIQLDLDTKYKVAIQAGLKWTPMKKMLKQIKADYTIITPYMYTHRKESAYEDLATLGSDEISINYLNYTHDGQCIGASMEPNSDRIRFDILVIPTGKVKVNLKAAYFRHGNASEDAPSLDDAGDAYTTPATDGTIFDPGYDYVNGDHLFETMSFLDQEVIEKTIQLGFDAKYKTPFWKGNCYLSLGYTLEIIQNYNLVDGNDETFHYVTVGLDYEF